MDQAIRHGSREKYMEGKTLHVSEDRMKPFIHGHQEEGECWQTVLSKNISSSDKGW